MLCGQNAWLGAPGRLLKYAWLIAAATTYMGTSERPHKSEMLRSVLINEYIMLVLFGMPLQTDSHEDFIIFAYNVCTCNCLCVVCCFFSSLFGYDLRWV